MSTATTHAGAQDGGGGGADASAAADSASASAGASNGAAPVAEARQGAVEGVIKPPPDLRLLVDKTAEHVAMRGKAFEESIRSKMKGKPKFDFLKPGHPYYRYYAEKVDELSLKEHLRVTKEAKAKTPEQQEETKSPSKEGKQIDEASSHSSQKEQESKTEKASKSEVIERAAKIDATAGAVRKRRTRAPPPLQFTVAHPIDTEPAATIDLVKLTAKYAAVLGDSFVSKVGAREQHNPEFSFLKASDRVHGYFKEMTAMYSKILDWQETVRVATGDFKDPMSVLDRAVHRVEWESDQALREREAKAQEREEFVAFNQIDWHDFVLVETISFDDKAPSPAPGAQTTADAPTASNAASGLTATSKGPDPGKKPAQAADAGSDSDSDVDMDMDDSDDEEGPIRVRTDYQAQVRAQAVKDTKLALPDGRQMDANDVNEHMRKELIDPKWKEQKERFLEKQKVQAFAEQDISRNLGRMAAHRPDVFSTDEGAAKRARDEDEAAQAKGASLTWDGTVSSAAAVTAEAQRRKQEARGRRDDDAAPQINYSVGPAQAPPSKRSKQSKSH
ncbi:Splicing factor 3A subunit 1 [Hondaea fermentalgiana]|uniref:Splicing factor 3A subunit 1 n=1 Tax=Hondaea fermentalgiana TaxID=2315210 RepID=A0A2R5GDB2_9STRA|nr:Splicing factor 3A subunit 1 [Hondaea fermentalgiana]|eukprot:GBG25794.1 Splicing factor 3A subunit 1 [Hondaea fermentalgiana]